MNKRPIHGNTIISILGYNLMNIYANFGLKMHNSRHLYPSTTLKFGGEVFVTPSEFKKFSHVLKV